MIQILQYYDIEGVLAAVPILIAGTYCAELQLDLLLVFLGRTASIPIAESFILSARALAYIC